MTKTLVWGAFGALVVTVCLVAGGAGARSIFDDFGTFGRSSFDDPFDDFDVCDPTDSILGSVVDVSSRRTAERTTSRDISLDEDNVLLGIALSNNGFGRVNFLDLADIDARSEIRDSFDQRTDIDRDDILTAVALGGSGRSLGSGDALACATDRSFDRRVDTDVSQRIDLDDDTALLAIALRNNGGGFLDFDDIFSGDRSISRTVSFDSTSDLDRDSALWLLAFG